MAQGPTQFFSWIISKWTGSLRLRHTILLSGIILLLMGLISSIMLSVQRSTLREAAEAKGRAFTQAFALGGWAAIHENLFRIQEALLEYSQDPDIRGIEVIDTANMIIAAKVPQQIGLILEDQQWLDMKSQEGEVIHYTEDPTGEQLLIIVAPLTGKGKIEAWIRVIFSLEDLRRQEEQLVLRMTLITLLLMAAGIFGVQWAQKQVSGLLQKVIANLQDALSKLKAPNESSGMEDSSKIGDGNGTKVVQGDIEHLGETVTETVGLLKTQSEALRESTQLLEQKVMDRTADLMESKRSLEKEIAERRLAQDQLEFMSRQNQLILNSAGEGIYGLDLDGKVTFVNPAGAKLLGYGVEELLGQSLHQLAQNAKPQDGPNLPSDGGMYSIFKNGAVHQDDNEVMWKKDGTAFPVEYTSTSILEHGQLAGLVVTFRDITERKQTEEAMHQARLTAESANRAKSDFLASMSHELRTPLNGILGYAQILKRDPGLADKQKAGIEVIQRSGEHLLTLINDILDLAKIEAQKLEIQATDFQLPECLQQIAKIIRIRAEQSELSFFYEPSSDIPQVVRGDEKRLRQILLNLLSNAVKFTEKGKVALTAEYDRSIRGHETLHLQVKDTGRGIPAEKIEEIFLPFQQVGDHTRQQEGTGLGLAITKKLVRLMGGSLQVTSKVGEGSTFGVTLPLPPVKHWTPVLLDQERTITGFRGPRKRVLVVDDRWENRAIIGNLLSPLGFEVEEAADGAEGLKRAQEKQPDLIVMDLVMPGIDGLEATRLIRHSPKLKDIPIIASSASAFDFNRQDAINAGCSDFLPKPVRAEDLFAQLQLHMALEWVYTPDKGSADSLLKEDRSLIAPPRQELTVLLDLAKGGKIMAIRKHLDTIDQLGDQYRPFVEELRKIAKGFDMSQLTKFLMPFTESHK